MKKIFLIIFIIFGWVLIFFNSEKNFLKQIEIKQNTIEKPNSLPSKEYANNTSFGFKNLKANYYWLQLIQYVGGNAFSSSYKEYLFTMTDLITHLNPYFSEPYVLAQLLLPSYNAYYENLSEENQELKKKQAVEIGLKGINNFCDLEKIKLIDSETNLEKLLTEEKYKNPCTNYEIAYNLAFIYSNYLKDYKNAVKFYKVSSVIDGVPDGAKNLISILEGKGGDREKSFFMFLDMAKYTSNGNEICDILGKELNNIGLKIFIEKQNLDGNLLELIEKTRKDNIFEDEKGFSSSSCGTFLNKSIRELNVYYLDEANKNYFEKFNKNSIYPKDLKKYGFIDYIPIDYQQEKDYGIIYFYNPELNSYDYKMGIYK